MDDRSCQPSEDMLRSLEVEGWEEWLARLDTRLERPVSICGECRMAKGSKVFFIPCFFIPCFFMPPEKTIALPYVDGTFAWNNAWGASLIDSADTCRPIKNHTINLVGDAIFLDSVCSLAFSLRACLTMRRRRNHTWRQYPPYSSHYGTTGQWAFSKSVLTLVPA